jgi:hypothetical protein
MRSGITYEKKGSYLIWTSEVGQVVRSGFTFRHLKSAVEFSDGLLTKADESYPVIGTLVQRGHEIGVSSCSRARNRSRSKTLSTQLKPRWFAAGAFDWKCQSVEIVYIFGMRQAFAWPNMAIWTRGYVEIIYRFRWQLDRPDQNRIT